MQLQQIDVTGSRIIGPIIKHGHAAPMHHGIILGKSAEDGQVYIAESMYAGYKIATYHDFCKRYAPDGKIIIAANDGTSSDLNVAEHAIEEVKKGGRGAYNLIADNRESFASRVMHGKSVSKRIIKTAIGIAVRVGAAWVVKNAEK